MAFCAARTWGFFEAGLGGGETDVRFVVLAASASRAFLRAGSLGETARRAAREWTVISGIVISLGHERSAGRV